MWAYDSAARSRRGTSIGGESSSSFVDIARRQEDPEKGLLPSYHHVIVDEAHHLEDIATHFFSKQCLVSNF